MAPSADLGTIPQEGVFRDVCTRPSDQRSLCALPLGGKHRDDLHTGPVLKVYDMAEIRF